METCHPSLFVSRALAGTEALASFILGLTILIIIMII